MIADMPRVRMIAGPNGSGKSTVISILKPEFLGIYINPDEIEKKIRTLGYIDFSHYAIHPSQEIIIDFFQNSVLLSRAGLLDEIRRLTFSNNKLSFHAVECNSYWASVISDFIRYQLLAARASFTFETVMSSPDKIEFLKKAQAQGFRTYLYYVATNSPEVNIARVANRVLLGGHSVPEEKIITRYHRSLGLLLDAIRYANRAYIFDNSDLSLKWLAEITNGKVVEIKSDRLPAWFENTLSKDLG